MSDEKKSRIGKVALVAAALVAVAVLIWLIFRPSSAKADPVNPPTPNPDPPVVGPIVVSPDPYSPTTKPTKGSYYAVKKGDSDALICIRAGFASVYNARRALRTHILNAWIGLDQDGDQLWLFQGWAPMPGYESKPWAWKTPRLGYGGHKWPVVYVPRDNEVEAS